MNEIKYKKYGMDIWRLYMLKFIDNIKKYKYILS